MKLTQSQMSCSRYSYNAGKTGSALTEPWKKVLFLKVCRLAHMLPDTDHQSVLLYPKVGERWGYQKGIELFTFVFLWVTWLQSSPNSLSPPGGGVPLLPGR